MGVIPSQTSYYNLPSNAIRICHGGHDGRCFCNGGYHRKEKYVFVDKRSDGRERYHDMMDLMGRYMMGQAGGLGNIAAGGVGGQGGTMPGGVGWPFRDAREWTIRDYDRLGDVMKEFYDRERGRGRWAPGEHNGGGPGGMGGPQMMPGMGMYPGMMPGMNPQMMNMGMNMPMGPGMMPPPPGSDPYTSSRGPQHQHPSIEEFQRLQQDLEEKFREYNRHMGILFGTEQDRQKDQYRATMLKTLSEIMPQLAHMMAQQSMMGGARVNPAMMNMPPGIPPQGMMPPMQNPMSYGPANAAMMGQAPPQMQSPYDQGQGYYNEPLPPRRPYRRKRWQDRYDDGDAFCSETEQRRTTPWDSHPHHGPAGRFRAGRDDDMFDGGPGGAMPSRPRPSGPFDGPKGGPGLGDTFTHSRADRFAPPPPPPPPVTTMGMGDTMPPTMSGALHSHSPHLGRRPLDTQPPFPSSRPGLARSNTTFIPSRLDPDLAAGPSGAKVRIDIDSQMEAGAGAFDGGFGAGTGRGSMGGGFGRSSMGDGLGPGVSSMGTAMGMQGMGAGYVPETTKLSQGRDVEGRRDEADAGQGIVDHTGR